MNVMNIMYYVKGAEDAKLVAGLLIEHSAWFQFLPIPFDVYEFTIKRENMDWVEKIDVHFLQPLELAALETEGESE